MNKTITFLGTGDAMATKCYNACFIIHAGEEGLLIDCGGGNGILTQLEKSGLDVCAIDHLFLTHKHTDHLLGAIWMIRDIGQRTMRGLYPHKLYIYGNNEVMETLRGICSLLFHKALLECIEKSIVFHTITDGEAVETSEMTLRFFDVQSAKCQQHGIAVAFHDHTRLAYLGDEPFHEANRAYAVDADWLISEAFCLSSRAEALQPYKIGHSTVLDAGKHAQSLHAKTLILVHTVDHDLAERRAAYTAEAKTVFDGNVIVPDDLEVITLT